MERREGGGGEGGGVSGWRQFHVFAPSVHFEKKNMSLKQHPLPGRADVNNMHQHTW